MRWLGLGVSVLVAACGGGGPLAGTCTGLSEAACKAQDGCIADYCPGCVCNVSYKGCRTASEPVPMCPGLGCPTGNCCTSDGQCDTSLYRCNPPGATVCGGQCTPGAACDRDAQCTGGQICTVDSCACQLMVCRDGCSLTNPCPDGQTCGSDSHCRPTACPPDCPTDFTCVAGTCERMRCTGDRECPAGFCISGSCYPSLGQCVLQPI